MSLARAGRVPQEPILEAQSGRVTYSEPLPGGRKGGGIRGACRDLTDRSRRRFQSQFASVDWSALAASRLPILFLTLSLPPEYWFQFAHVHESLERFEDRLRYGFGGILGWKFHWWRLEKGKKSGALHVHLIVVGVPYLPAGMMRTWWKEALRDTSARTIRVHVEAVDTPERVAKYLGKYCAKAAYEGRNEEAPEVTGEPTEAHGDTGAPISLSKAQISGNTGRWWGLRGRSNVPFGDIQTFEGDFAKVLAKRLRRIFRRWMRSKGVEFYKKLSGCRKTKDGDLVRCPGYSVFAPPGLVSKLFEWASEQVFHELYEECPF